MKALFSCMIYMLYLCAHDQVWLYLLSFNTEKGNFMKEANRLKAQERMNDSNVYKAMEQTQRVMDDYYLDGILGLLPYGIGDILSALFALLYVWFAFVKIRSLPLALAIINNSLRDVLLGLIPFYIGDVIDFFHKANRENMQLVRGFVEGDKEVIRDVNRKAVQSVLLIVLMIVLIIAMIVLLVSLTTWLIHLIGSLF